MATNRVVSKKELEDSGLSLRDFLNKERGLTRKAPEGTKSGVNVARPTAQDMATMRAQENADKGLDEKGNPLRDDSANVRRDQYRESGKAAVDKQDEATRRDATMAAYTPRRDANAAARARLGKGEGDEAGNAMKRGGAVKATPKRATGYRGYGIAKKV
jgi:hypothetical protein